MRLIVYSLIALLVTITYHIPQLHVFFLNYGDFDGYRTIILTVILARLLIEAVVQRTRTKKWDNQLHEALEAQRHLTLSLTEQQNARQEAVRAGEQLQQRLLEQEVISSELIAARDEAAALRTAFADQVQKFTALEAESRQSNGSHGGDDAINLLSLLQQKGRFVDFVMEDITSVPDAQVGAAARVVHQGCGRVLADLFSIKPVRDVREGQGVVIADGADMDDYRLVGRVKDEPPYEGKLIHRGWQTDRVDLPKISSQRKQAGRRVIAPAEIELS